MEARITGRDKSHPVKQNPPDLPLGPKSEVVIRTPAPMGNVSSQGLLSRGTDHSCKLPFERKSRYELASVILKHSPSPAVLWVLPQGHRPRNELTKSICLCGVHSLQWGQGQGWMWEMGREAETRTRSSAQNEGPVAVGAVCEAPV